MRQYTTPDQTAKLIKLGFEKPKIIVDSILKVDGQFKGMTRYTLGELLSFLPPYINDQEDEDNVFELTIFCGTKWTVSYGGIFELKIGVTENELTDSIFAMIIKLKEEKLI